MGGKFKRKKEKKKKKKKKKGLRTDTQKGSTPRKLGGWDECPKKATGGVEGR